MIRISSPTIIELDFQKIDEISGDEKRKKFAFEESNLRIDSTRVGDIQLNIRILDGVKPDGLFIYFFQQFTKVQHQPKDLSFHTGNEITVLGEESDFWKNNPLYVDRIGILGRGKGKCKLQVEVFRTF